MACGPQIIAASSVSSRSPSFETVFMMKTTENGFEGDAVAF
jgi:hypothetical protein